MTIEQMAALAQAVLTPVEHAPEWLSIPQAYVLVTKNGAVYTVINDDFDSAIQALLETQDTEVQSVLTMWKDGTPDLPSYAFRTALLELDPTNSETELAGSFRTLGSTMAKNI